MAAPKKNRGGRPWRNLVGWKFGLLECVGVDQKRSEEMGTEYWWTKCACGKRASVRKECLIRGTTQSCGCVRRTILDPDVKAMNVSKQRKYQIMRERAGKCSHCPAGKEQPLVPGLKTCAEHRAGGEEALLQERAPRTGDEIEAALAVLRKERQAVDAAEEFLESRNAGNVYPWIVKCVRQALATGRLVEVRR